MPGRPLRLRWRRQLKRSQRQVEDLGYHAEASLEEHLLKRVEHLKPVRRFVIGWVGLVLILIAVVIVENFALGGYYLVPKTIPGGIYNEGVLGLFTNANPLYATSDADSTVSHLIFAGLLQLNAKGQLVGNLAQNYSTSDNGMTYTVNLKHNLKWQDGQPLTSRDVKFTYQTIQDPDAQSPLFSSWQGITVTAPDPYTVIFQLPNALASFPYNLTNGI